MTLAIIALIWCLALSLYAVRQARKAAPPADIQAQIRAHLLKRLEGIDGISKPGRERLRARLANRNAR